MEIPAHREDEVNRRQLSHVLRAASRVAADPEVIVIGSQAILGSFDDADLPMEATRSMEADLAFRDDIDDRKSDLVDGSIGELSSFHERFGYYAQGVSIATAVVPSGWDDRVVAYMEADSAPSHAICLDPHDLVVSKLVAGRQKDIEFAKALLEASLISVKLLVERAEMLEVPRAVITRVRSTIDRLSIALD
ncbi:MAG: DUF6036 family nucleotidyltransferase [Ilumatobacteraceae bacterium]